VEYVDAIGDCCNVKVYSGNVGGSVPMFEVYETILKMQKNPHFAEDACWNVCYWRGIMTYLTLRRENLDNFTTAAHDK
jgi:hypothetical protein